MSHSTCEWGTSHTNEACHIWMRHVTYEWGMSHMNACVMSHVNVSCHEWIRGRIHAPLAWVMSQYIWGMSHMNESCHTWTRLRRVTCVWDMSYMNASHHIWMRSVTHERVLSDIHVSHHTKRFEVVVMPHWRESCCNMYFWCVIFVCMGWLRLVGSLKL